MNSNGDGDKTFFTGSMAQPETLSDYALIRCIYEAGMSRVRKDDPIVKGLFDEALARLPEKRKSDAKPK